MHCITCRIEVFCLSFGRKKSKARAKKESLNKQTQNLQNKVQFTQESSNMSNLLELGPDFPLLISLFGYQSNARACSSLRYKTGHREMARILPLGSGCCAIESLLHSVTLITIFYALSKFLPLNDINANRGRCFLCLSIVSFLIPICVGAHYLKITMYKYSSH